MSENQNSENTFLAGEKEILLDHDYDGIQELDNPLPSWWQMTFYGGIVFAVFYFIYYTVLDGPSIMDEYQAQWAVVQEAKDLLAQEQGSFDMSQYQAWVAANDGLKRGAVVFEENCAACHLEKGQGDIGPNLTDAYWIHGDGEVEFLYKMVLEGYEDNGMPAWSEVLTQEDIWAVVSFVETMKNTNEPGKEPEGELVE